MVLGTMLSDDDCRRFHELGQRLVGEPLAPPEDLGRVRQGIMFLYGITKHMREQGYSDWTKNPSQRAKLFTELRESIGKWEHAVNGSEEKQVIVDLMARVVTEFGAKLADAGLA